MMNNHAYHIMLSGGGTGGHIFPAVAIADGLRAAYPKADIQFVGAVGRMEMEKVPQAGYPISGLVISGIQRRLTLSNLRWPFQLVGSLIGAYRLISKHRPVVVIGTGGYASGPLLYIASRLRIPTLILEQNSYPGLTNKWLAGRVNKICVAYPGMERYFPSDKIVITGAPIRDLILKSNIPLNQALEFFGLSSGRSTILIIGGSQGALRVNQAVASMLARGLDDNWQLIWQTGTSYEEEANRIVNELNLGEQVKVMAFINRMDMAYGASDLVISRAGAIAIAEIVAVRKPAIFIPLPSAAEDHQTKNAQALVSAKAGVLVPEKVAAAELYDTVRDLLSHPEKRKSMTENLLKFAHQDATGAIVKEIEKIITAHK